MKRGASPRAWLLPLAVALALAVPSPALAHSGGTAGDGCHWNRTVAPPARHYHGDAAAAAACPAPTGDRWRGLAVAPECRCTPYDRDDYPTPASVEARIARRDGMVSPYDGRRFDALTESDIEHRGLPGRGAR